MISLSYRKILRDILQNKMRAVLAIFSIAVGVFAVGVISHMRLIVQQDIAENYARVSPANATIFTVDPFDETLVEQVRHMEGVREAEGRRSVIGRFKHKSEPDVWRSIEVFALPDYNNIRINKVWPEGRFDWIPDPWPGPAVWPPPEQELLLERTSLVRPDLGLSDAQLGDTILINLPNGAPQEMRIAGLTHDLTRLPASFAGRAYAYVTFDTLEGLGQSPTYNELKIVVDGDSNDQDYVQGIANQVKQEIEQSQRVVLRVSVPQPGVHPMDRVFQAMSLILGILGVITLLLSGSLVANTVSAVLTQQVRQIGVMKAVGADTTEIVRLYLTMVVVFGLFALVIAVPLGLLAAREFIRFMSFFINFKLTVGNLPLEVLLIEIAVGLIVPVLAGLYPLINGAKITVREALMSYGVDKAQFGRSRIDQIIERVRGLPEPLLLALRNNFRRKGRMALTLTTLALSGAIFISVLSVRSSLLFTLDVLLNQWQFDARVQFSQPYSTEEMEREALRVPGVTIAEGWELTGAHRLRDDGSESEDFILFGVPDNTEMADISMIQGRWLRSGEANEIVLTIDVMQNEPDLEIGDEIVLKIGLLETPWRIVGLADSAGPGTAVYVNYKQYARVVGEEGLANNILVKANQHDPDTQTEVMRLLEKNFDNAGYNVHETETTTEIREGNKIYYNIIVIFLMIMAMLLALVGGLGLMGTMSINVLERRREIGIMRAIGATGSAVMGILIGESVFIGVVSWVIATVLAYPLGSVLSDAVGTRFIQRPLDYAFSVEGVALWLLIVVIFSIVATIVPAWNAARLSVNTVLAYE